MPLTEVPRNPLARENPRPSDFQFLALSLVLAIAGVANGARWHLRVSLGDWATPLSDLMIIAIAYVAAAGLASAFRRRFPADARFRPGWIAAAGLVAAALTIAYFVLAAARTREAAFQNCRASVGVEAMLACMQALHLGPHDRRDEAVLLNNRGLVLQKAGMPQRAVTDFDKALATDPSLASAWFNRGLARASLLQWDQAIADFAKAGRLSPDRSAIWASRGTVLLLLGKTEEAIADFDRAIGLNDKEVSAWSGRGTAYYLNTQERQHACESRSQARDRIG